MFEKICSITSQLLYVIAVSLLLLPLLALAQTFTHVHLRVPDTNEAGTVVSDAFRRRF